MPEVLRASADGRFAVVRTEAGMADALAAIQEASFPTLSPGELMRPEHFRAHVGVFPEGQHAVVETATGRVVASATDLRTQVDFAHFHHRYLDAVGGNWLTTHDPQGDWLYGADIGVHPDYRGRGLALALYAARQELVWTLGLEGQVTAGMMSGYGAVKDRMSAEEYYEGLVAGRINDPTLSMQRRVGFEFRGLLKDYLQDPVCDNYSVLIVLDAARDVEGAVRPGAAREPSEGV